MATAKALLVCCMMVLAAGHASAAARELQQAAQQQPDLGGLVNQIGAVATQGIQSVLQNGGQAGAGGGNGSQPLAGIGNALQNLGASLNNRTGGATAGAAPAAQKPDDSLLADPTEITQNVTGGLGSILSNISSAVGNATAPGMSSTSGSGSGPAPITPPPGMKSGAAASGLSALATLAASAILLVQLLA